MTYPTESEHAPELDATQARQGLWGRHMLWVLLAALALAVIALFGAWLSRAGDLAAADNRLSAQAAPPTTAPLLAIRNKTSDMRPGDPAPAQTR